MKGIFKEMMWAAMYGKAELEKDLGQTLEFTDDVEQIAREKYAEKN